MKVISLWRPWGLAVIQGYKTIETRSHRNFRSLAGQRIAIHNTAKWHKDARVIMQPYLSRKDGDAAWFFRQKFHPPMAIIGTVYVEAFRELQEPDADAALCPITTNKWGLILKDHRRLKEPILVPGAMGIWEYEVKE